MTVAGLGTRPTDWTLGLDTTLKDTVSSTAGAWEPTRADSVTEVFPCTLVSSALNPTKENGTTPFVMVSELGVTFDMVTEASGLGVLIAARTRAVGSVIRLLLLSSSVAVSVRLTPEYRSAVESSPVTMMSSTLPVYFHAKAACEGLVVVVPYWFTRRMDSGNCEPFSGFPPVAGPVTTVKEVQEGLLVT